MSANSVTGTGNGEAGVTRGPGNGRNQFYSLLDSSTSSLQSIIKINYSTGGTTWMFSSVFNQLPTISVCIVLKNLADSLLPLTVKIISLTVSQVVIKAYKSFLDVNGDIVFSECDTDDVVLHITARGQ
jgi:hypothetical protein